LFTDLVEQVLAFRRSAALLATGGRAFMPAIEAALARIEICLELAPNL
jgi:hypothetical protein